MDAKLDRILDELADMRASMAEIKAALASKPAPQSAPRSGGGSAGGACFPNYGRAKGQPVIGATRGDLDYYAAGCRRTLDDPGKARWHAKERDLLAAIESEIARQSGSAPPSGETEPFPFGGGSGGDDEIPF